MGNTEALGGIPMVSWGIRRYRNLRASSRSVCGTTKQRLVDELFARNVANSKTTRLATHVMSVNLQSLRVSSGQAHGTIKQILVNELFARNVVILHARPDIARHAAPAETRLARKQQKEVIALMKYKHCMQSTCRQL